MTTLHDLKGQRFDRWTVIERAANGHRGRTMWLCRCDCGTVKPVSAAFLPRGLSRSCGCLRTETTIKRSTKHGYKPRSGTTTEYDAWCNMKTRCLRKTHARYPDWGGRGITVCERWTHDFAAFLSDMGPRPKGYTLDRIDNDGPYSPENCRWATPLQQRHNRRDNHYKRQVVFNGESHTMAEWARQLHVPFSRISTRLKRGWPIERALTP